MFQSQGQLVYCRHTYQLLKKFSREHTLYTSYYWHENDHTLMSITSCQFKERKVCQIEGGTIVQDPGRNLYDIKVTGCKVLFSFKIIHMDLLFSLSCSCVYLNNSILIFLDHQVRLFVLNYYMLQVLLILFSVFDRRFYILKKPLCSDWIKGYTERRVSRQDNVLFVCL